MSLELRCPVCLPDGDTCYEVIEYSLSITPEERATRDYPGCPESVEILNPTCPVHGDIDTKDMQRDLMEQFYEERRKHA